MDEFLALLTNPTYLFGVATGGALCAVCFALLLALLGALDDIDATDNDRRGRNPLDRIEHLQRTGEALRYGSPTPSAANDATLDLRDAYRRPRSARAELRSAPR